MNLGENMQPGIRGDIEVFYRYPDREETVLKKKNVILFSAADVITKALAGQLAINGMYLAYENSAPPIAEDTPPQERTALYYQSTGSTDPRGFNRVSTVAQASFDSTEANYNNNKVTFVSISDGEVAIADGGNAVADGTSQYYGAALAYLDPSDLNNDILFSAVTFADLGGPSEFEKIAGAQIGVRWSITITIS